MDGKWSLKTQADKQISRNSITLHKYMEIGSGKATHADYYTKHLTGFLQHLRQYQRLLVLRCHENTRNPDTHHLPDYELLEIPIPLLQQASRFPLIIDQQSTQTPHPATITILDENQSIQARIQFEGGGERKIRISRIPTDACIRHTLWEFPKKKQNAPRVEKPVR